MIYWQNRILTNVKTLLGDKCKRVVSTSSNISAKFPAVSVQIVGNSSFADDLDIGGEEEAVYCTVQIEAFTKTSLAEAVEIMGIVNVAMHRMGFRRRTGPRQIDNPMSPEIYRMVARYGRVIGDADVIEKFETIQDTENSTLIDTAESEIVGLNVT